MNTRTTKVSRSSPTIKTIVTQLFPEWRGRKIEVLEVDDDWEHVNYVDDTTVAYLVSTSPTVSPVRQRKSEQLLDREIAEALMAPSTQHARPFVHDCVEKPTASSRKLLRAQGFDNVQCQRLPRTRIKDNAPEIYRPRADALLVMASCFMGQDTGVEIVVLRGAEHEVMRLVAGDALEDGDGKRARGVLAEALGPVAGGAVLAAIEAEKKTAIRASRRETAETITDEQIHALLVANKINDWTYRIATTNTLGLSGEREATRACCAEILNTEAH